MATKVKFEVIAKNGTYTNSEGVEKTKWHKCGVVLESDKGLSMKLESLPIVFDGWLNLWEPTPKDAPKQEKRGSIHEMESDVPF